jgi:hypothetical protein
MRTPESRMARRLQRLAEEELGTCPRLTLCLEIVREAEPWPRVTREELAAQLFLAHRERLAEEAGSGEP